MATDIKLFGVTEIKTFISIWWSKYIAVYFMQRISCPNNAIRPNFIFLMLSDDKLEELVRD